MGAQKPKGPAVTEALTDAAKEKAAMLVKRARTQLVLSKPFFGVLALRLEVVPMSDLPTLATDGIRLLYNPAYVLHLAKEEGEDVIVSASAHEILHCAFEHMLRKSNLDAQIWNMSGDYIINQILQEDGFKLGKGWLHDSKYAGWSIYQVYDDLQKKQQSQPQAGQGQGKGQPQPGSNKAGGQGHDHKNGCGWLKEPEGAHGKMTEEEKRIFQAENKQAVSQAAAVAKMCGKMPGTLKRFVDEMLESKTPWQSLLRLFLEQHSKNDYTWNRPSRRYMNSRFYLPSLSSMECGEIGLFIDTSGSIGRRELNQFASEFNAILETVKPSMVHVLHVDAEVAHYETFESEDLPVVLAPHGGGGTDFAPAFAYIKEKGIDIKAAIYLTDMECNSFGEMPPYPVFWGSIGDRRWATEPVPFGEVVRIDLNQ